jgi:peptide-methionine (R)-S-oxide reductase
VALDRRELLAGTIALGWTGGLTMAALGTGVERHDGERFEFELTDAEWRARLTPEQYAVLRGHGTERPGSCSLNREKRPGIFHCAGCGQALFDARTKYDSGTGWPSFGQPIEGAVGYRIDRRYGMVRTEVHCRRCGGHLGHVFDDGPPPTGKRYCINGVALTFRPLAETSGAG